MTLTPQIAQRLAYRFGIDYMIARRSRVLAQLVVVETRIDTLSESMRAARARIRAYRRARKLDRADRAGTLNWLALESVAHATWTRARVQRARLQIEAERLKARVVSRLFAEPVLEVPDDAETDAMPALDRDARDADARLRALFAIK